MISFFCQWNLFYSHLLCFKPVLKYVKFHNDNSPIITFINFVFKWINMTRKCTSMLTYRNRIQCVWDLCVLFWSVVSSFLCILWSFFLAHSLYSLWFKSFFKPPCPTSQCNKSQKHFIPFLPVSECYSAVFYILSLKFWKEVKPGQSHFSQTWPPWSLQKARGGRLRC